LAFTFDADRSPKSVVSGGAGFDLFGSQRVHFAYFLLNYQRTGLISPGITPPVSFSINRFADIYIQVLVQSFSKSFRDGKQLQFGFINLR
jgi:hypothetical protein